MLDNKTIPEKIAFEEEIRDAIDGYWSLYPLTLDNYFYDYYKRSWNNFRNDYEKHNASNSRASYLTIMRAARKERIALYEKCCQQLYKIEEFINAFIWDLDQYCSGISGTEKSQLKYLIASWKDIGDSRQYASLSLLTNTMLQVSDFAKVEVEEPWGNLHFYINKTLQLFEQRIKMLASYYAMFWGMDGAINSVINYGKLLESDEYIKNSYPHTHFSTYKLIDRKLRTLLSLGHLLDPSIRLRFLSLTKNKNYSQIEAYDEIKSELVELGLNPDELLPPEAKSLGDRARRYRDKQFEELSSLGKQ